MKGKSKTDEEEIHRPPNDGNLWSRGCCDSLCGGTPVFMVNPDGSFHKIGITATCPGKFDPKRKGWVRCDRIYRIKKFAKWPDDLDDKTWGRISHTRYSGRDIIGGAWSWLGGHGFYVYRRHGTGALVNFQELNWIPEYTSPAMLTEQCRSYLQYRAKMDPCATRKLHVDFLSEDLAKAKAFPKVEERPLARDGYAPEPVELDDQDVPF